MLIVKKFTKNEEILNCGVSKIIDLYDFKSWKSLFNSLLSNIGKVNDINQDINISIIEEDIVSLFININNNKEIKLIFNSKDSYVDIMYYLWNGGNIYRFDMSDVCQINLLSLIIINHINYCTR